MGCICNGVCSSLVVLSCGNMSQILLLWWHTVAITVCHHSHVLFLSLYFISLSLYFISLYVYSIYLLAGFLDRIYPSVLQKPLRLPTGHRPNSASIPRWFKVMSLKWRVNDVDSTSVCPVGFLFWPAWASNCVSLGHGSGRPAFTWGLNVSPCWIRG